jgi:hypothetical protein
MQIDPVAEWQRLTDFYRAKDDEELEELAEDFGNLTETAQDVLTTELRSRGLPMPGRKSQADNAPLKAPRDSRFASLGDPDGLESDNDYDSDIDSEDEVPIEFTWKTMLCECNDRLEAWQLTQALKRVGIESWIEHPGSGVVYPRVLVPADQLEEARAIANQPIPQDIVAESHDLDAKPDEYVTPACPACHEEDPILESADPSNNWLCEACGARWSDPLPDSGTDPAQTAK